MKDQPRTSAARSLNGEEPQTTLWLAQGPRHLTPAQGRHFQELMAAVAVCEAQVSAAQNAQQQAIGVANGFLRYCAQEHGVTLGQDDWLFDQGALSFVRPGVEANASPRAGVEGGEDAND